MDIYVGNLPYGASDTELNELFSNYGTVSSARVIIDRFSGQSRGFGFVEMSTQEEAEKAIQGLNGTDHEGRSLTVNVAKPRADRPRGPSSAARAGRHRDAAHGLSLELSISVSFFPRNRKSKKSPQRARAEPALAYHGHRGPQHRGGLYGRPGSSPRRWRVK